MDYQHHRLPVRWVLPFVQLAICLIALWPLRGFLIFEARGSMPSYSDRSSEGDPVLRSKIVIPAISPEEQQRADLEIRQWELRKAVPQALDFPVLVAELPYILIRPGRREWTPRGMYPADWHALSWPVAGMVFWWYLGRAIEAVSAARRSVVFPRIKWFEVAYAVALFVFGVVALVGIVTSTPDDRRDVQFLALLSGGILWGALSTLPIVARLMQRRIAQRNAASGSAVG
jgi:hypothetical protein